jgi:iron(III) transport system permease protein
VNRNASLWLAVGGAGFVLLPWYAIDEGFWSLEWVFGGYPLDSDYAPGIVQIVAAGRFWLIPVAAFLLLPFAVLGRDKSDPLYSPLLILAGGGGLVCLLGQGFAIGLEGWELPGAQALFGPVERQFGMGYGPLLVAAAFLFLLTNGLAARGYLNGDVFFVGSIGLVIALVAAFILFPVSRVLVSAVQDNQGNYSLGLFLGKLFSEQNWGLACLYSTVGCGVAWNSLVLAVAVGFSTTVLGLAFALVATRSALRGKHLLRMLTVLPIITPPFVIGLAIILLFGRSGAVTQFLAQALDIPAGRWVYGFTGVWFAQTMAFTPIAFLVLIGVVEGVSPAMEEAAQMLRASRWKTFTTVTLPMMRPGLANAFLLAFIESMADFGNPFVLGGSFDVLSTEIFFAIVGAQHDQGRAAVLAIVLLTFTLSAFYLQRGWLGRKSYVTVTGKGDAGVPMVLPAQLRGPIYAVVLPWTALTVVIYAMILFGGFVKTWGLDHSFSLQHYIDAFSITAGEHGLVWSGAAWNSFFMTILLSAISAPLTAAVGMLTAYLLARKTFAGREAFEFGTMLSFAIPGTVIGISYILAFNVPPFELTGTGAILVICFLFRNMPVGIRAGIASMSQLDKSLDEASWTLGANSWVTLRRVVLPLLRPAVVAALVFSFVRAMTAISAVIFLVSANYHMATAYIIGRVENGDFGIAIAYSSVLIVVMLIAIVLVQAVVGVRRIGRRADYGAIAEGGG